jgi:tetratricopeptide (TPR) repeat protein
MPEKKSPKKKEMLKEAKRSLKKEFSQAALKNRVQKYRDEVVVFITSLKKIRNMTENNYELGKKHYNLGNFDDAVFRLQFVTWMEPKNASAWYWLGAAYLAVDKKTAARKALKKALELKPDWQDAQEMLKAANSGG